MKSNKIIEVTKKNIKRNKFLSLSTVMVTSVVLLISSFFISLGIIAQKGIEHYEKKAQVIVFFKRDTSESDILAMKERLYDKETTESITYISQQEALSIYKEDFADNPDLLATVTADSLPPSLEIKAKSVDSLMDMINRIKKEKETNASIDDVIYFKEVVNNLKRISSIIKVTSIILISALVIIAFLLIRITIGFNINSHSEEIKVMNLVGSPKHYITKPYILEGSLYGALGGFIATSILIIPLYIFLSSLTKDASLSYWLNQTLRDLGLLFIKPVNILFLLIYYLVHIGAGALIGVVSSLSAVKRYLE